MKFIFAFLILFLSASSAFCFEDEYDCQPISKSGAVISGLKITGNGEFSAIMEAIDGVAVSAEAAKVSLEKHTFSKVAFKGSAQWSAKGPYYELRALNQELINAIFISAVASKSFSSITTASGKEFSIDCQSIDL